MGKEWVVAGIVLVFAAPALAQPTFKLGVPPHLQPQATIKLDGNRIARSPVKDDPGFRLQFHVQKDGKTLADLDARASASIDVLKKEPGVYTVALELFYPSYKPGKEQKGHFLPISDSLTYRVAGEKLEALMPALILDCGKEGGKGEATKVGPGYGYKLLQGTSFDAWP